MERCVLTQSAHARSGVDRIPGHPASIDALVALTPDVIATGSEDGMIRVIQVLPHKFRESNTPLSVVELGS